MLEILLGNQENFIRNILFCCKKVESVAGFDIVRFNNTHFERPILKSNWRKFILSCRIFLYIFKNVKWNNGISNMANRDIKCFAAGA